MTAWRSPAPASLQWQNDGDLSAHDLFSLVCSLRNVEPAEHSNELWRLGQKIPRDDRPVSAEDRSAG